MNNKLTPRDRRGLGAEYSGYTPRRRQPGEALPPQIVRKPWEPLRDLQWQVRAGGEDAQQINSRGLAT